MSITLAANSYGKSEVRLVTVSRESDRHELKDIAVAIRLEGDFAAAYTHGDNAGVVATDTMKNTVYALAGERPFDDIEEFGLELTEHLTKTYPQVASARVELTEHLWERIQAGGEEHPSSFRRAGGERRTAVVTRSRDSDTPVSVVAGLDDLVVMKTASSAFAGFPRDRWTTLKDTSDRLLATALRATWRYARPYVPFGRLWNDVRRVLLETFAEHDSRSVQHTLYAMGKAVLETAAFGDVEEIHLAMPNRHHLPVDLTPFGGYNRNEIFVATTEPYGLIEATLRRE